MTTQHFVLILHTLWPGIPKSESTWPSAQGDLGAPFCQRRGRNGHSAAAALFLPFGLQQWPWVSSATTGATWTKAQIHTIAQQTGFWQHCCAVGSTTAWARRARDPPGLGLGRRWLVLTFVLGWGQQPSDGWSSVRAPCGEGLSGCCRRRAAPEIALHTARAWAGLCAAPGGQGQARAAGCGTAPQAPGEELPQAAGSCWRGAGAAPGHPSVRVRPTLPPVCPVPPLPSSPDVPWGAGAARGVSSTAELVMFLC